MTIRIDITLEPGETLLGRLRAAGILAGEPGVITAAEREEQAGLEPPAALTAALPQPPVTPPPGPEKPRRGRPPKVAAPEPSQGEAPAEVFLVRRYGGEADSEHETAAGAAARFTELLNAAGDAQAIDSLARANEELAEKLPVEIAEELAKRVDEAAAAFAPAEPAAPAEPPKPAAPAWPMTRDTQNPQPLTRITPDFEGGKDALFAIATGPEPKFGHMVGLALLEKHGVPKLSALEPTDPKVALIAREGAALLGLPVVEPEGLL